MAWVKSKHNGNVFEVVDEALVRQLESEGHEISEADPRIEKPKPAPKRKSK